MNKEITIYELIERKYQDNELPIKILKNKFTYTLNGTIGDYIKDNDGRFLFSDILKGDLLNHLQDTIEIIDLDFENNEENDEFEDIEEIVKLGCNIETQIGNEIHLIDIEKPLVTEIIINDINQLIRNQKKIIERLNKDE